MKVRGVLKGSVVGYLLELGKKCWLELFLDIINLFSVRFLGVIFRVFDFKGLGSI